ncbi:MAG: FAD:protein FMN transferase [Coriobacteriia bacterium]|nr:FAD:protein FMN transferase [Coriobacteriia bacterium]
MPLPRRHTSRAALLSLAALLAASLAVPACSRREGPVRESRDALGTVVTVTAYAEDDGAAREAVDAAYAGMAEVESALDAHDESSAVAAFNRDPYRPQPLPAEAVEVLRIVDSLDVGEWFSPAMIGVVRLYGFEEGGRVPEERELSEQVALAASFGPAGPSAAEPPPGAASDEVRWAFSSRPATAPPSDPPGLDFGGAAKGVALDRAAKRLRDGGVAAALLSSGSSTVAYGGKPDGEPWRVGLEDPREPETVVATVHADGGLVLSTSGDYQRYFERGDARYHHILDPSTGRPARGLQSLTVLGGELTALESDILSTALFVAGGERAEAYARERGLGLVTVDDEGLVHVVQPAGEGVRVQRAAP